MIMRYALRALVNPQSLPSRFKGAKRRADQLTSAILNFLRMTSVTVLSNGAVVPSSALAAMRVCRSDLSRRSSNSSEGSSTERIEQRVSLSVWGRKRAQGM